jgi:anti-sigma-K factor RskA
MYDDDRDALAAEYVLGTLSADEREQADAMLLVDPGFAEIVRVWERRLGELNVMVEAVEPPADVWDRIKTGIGHDGPRGYLAGEADFAAMGESAPLTPPEPAVGIAPEASAEMTSEPEPDLLSESQDLDLIGPPRDLDDQAVIAALASSLLPPEPSPEQAKTPPPEPPAAAPPKVQRSADVIYLSREARRWRGFTVAMSAIAALLAIYIGVEQFAPGIIPLSRQSPTAVASQAKPSAARLVAVLQQEPTAPAFLLTVELQSRTLTVRRLTAAPDADRSYELWLTPNKSASPHSLGLVGTDEFTTRPIPADFDAGALRAASYAISLEPAGGSTKGVPTGPILFTGTMVESLPGSPS